MRKIFFDSLGFSIVVLKKILLSLGFFLCASSGYCLDLTGAGASSPAPIYARWSYEYAKKVGDRINYQTVGSAAGLKLMRIDSIDFSSSDVPLSSSELTDNGFYQFPSVSGGIALAVNLPSVMSGYINLTGPVLADIFSGNIKNWSDSRIARLNPNAVMPNVSITVVYRSDSSGSTYNFTHYLSEVSSGFRDSIGVGKTVSWSVSSRRGLSIVGARGNAGVAVLISKLIGAIGYLEYSYTDKDSTPKVLLQNKAGFFVAPNVENFSAALQNISWSAVTNGDLSPINYSLARNAWPITTVNYVILKKKNRKENQAILSFFSWTLHQGSQFASDLDFVPLPKTAISAIEDSWRNFLK